MDSLSKAKPSLKRIAIVIPYKDTPVRLHEVLRDVEIILNNENFKVPLILLFDDGKIIEKSSYKDIVKKFDISELNEQKN